MFGVERRVESNVALVADVGRRSVRIGLTDESGRLDEASVREYDPTAQPTISTAISAFGAQCGMTNLPRRAAIAVSGVARGDTISVTNSRWILSRQGLSAMFQSPPLILNDFAAYAWAMSAQQGGFRKESISANPLDLQRPGTYCIIGVGSGLGVAVMVRDEHGFVTVLPTESGHMGYMDGLPWAQAVMSKLRKGGSAVPAEKLLSEDGLLALHRALCEINGTKPSASSAADLLRQGAIRSDPTVAETLHGFVRALWHFAGNIVLASGAWDGVVFTGSVVSPLHQLLLRQDFASSFALEGPYARRLREVPTVLATFKYPELAGAAVALSMHERRAAAAISV